MAARPTVGLRQALKNKIAIFIQENFDKPAPRVSGITITW